MSTRNDRRTEADKAVADLLVVCERSLSWIAKVAADQPEGDTSGLAARAMRQYDATVAAIAKAKGV